MANAKFTIGDGGTGSSLNWPEGNHGTIPAVMVQDGLDATLASLLITSSGIMQMQVKRGGFGASAGPQLLDSWESFDPAMILEAGSLRLELPGPNAPGITFRSATEPYSANVGTDHGQAAFITAYRALSKALRDATTLTLTDEVLGIQVPAFRTGRPRISAQLANRVDISALFRSGRPRIEATVDWPVVSEFRSGRPRIEAMVDGGIVANFRTGSPRFTVIPAADIPVAFRTGAPRFTVIPAADIPVEFRTGRPRISAMAVGDIVAEFRTGRPRIFVVPTTDPAATLRSGRPRMSAIIAGEIVASFRSGRPRMSAIPFSELRAEFRTGRPRISAMAVGDIVAEFRTGRPRISAVPDFLPGAVTGFHTELGDDYVLIELQDIPGLTDIGGGYEFQIDNGVWVPFTPS